MGIFDKVFGPKEIEGYKIEKTVKCGKCGIKMYFSEDIPAFARDIFVYEGSRCHTCGKYFCSDCKSDLSARKFQCCPAVATRGIGLLKYIDPRPLEAFRQGQISRYSEFSKFR